MKTILVSHGFGLGDHFLFNGMIRELAKQNDLLVFVWERNYKDVSFLMRDLKNVTLVRLFLESAEEFDYYVQNLKYDEMLLVNDHERILGKSFKLDVKHKSPLKNSYVANGFDWKLIFDNFHIERDYFTEDFLYRSLMQSINGRPYIIVHDDPQRGFNIDLNKIPEKNCEILFIDHKRNGFTRNFTVVQMTKIIENAVAFHGFASSWAWFVLFGKFPNIKKYLHVYTRPSNTPGFIDLADGLGWHVFQN